VQRTFLTAVAAVGTTGLMAVSVLAGSAMSASAASSGHVTGPRHDLARLPLSARQMLADRQLHMGTSTATGAITGAAQSANGQPLDDVCILASGPSGRRFTATQPDGRYLLAGLKAGVYQVRYFGCGEATAQYLPQWYGGASEQAQARSVTVSPMTLRPLAPVTMRTAAGESPTADDINTASPAAFSRSLHAAFGLPTYGTGFRPAAATTVAAVHGGQISGVVTSPSGQALAGICVAATSENGSAGTFTRTGKNGRYLTGRLPSGGYVVVFSLGCGNKGNWEVEVYNEASINKPTIVGISRGKITGGINGRLKLGGEITGTTTNRSGARLSGICVQPVGSGAFNSFDALYVLAISYRGTYELHGLSPGSYKLAMVPCGPSASAYASVWWPDKPSARGAKSIHVKAGQTVGRINEVMPLGGVISGTVTNQSNAPVKGICVFAYPAGSLSSSFGITLGGGGIPVTNAAGQYKVIGLNPGSYQVQFQLGCGNNGNYLPAEYPGKIKLNYGQVAAGVNVQLLTGATLSGTVTSAATTQPVKGVCVYLIGGGKTDYENPPQITSAAGTYSFDQMPAGTYYVQFVPGCGNTGSYAPQGYSNSSVFLPQVIDVAATGENVTGINAALQPGATVTGTVHGQGGRKLTGMCVNAASPTNGADFEANSKDGSYSISNMLPGQYEVGFSPGCNNNADLVAVVYGSQLNPPDISVPAGTTSGIDGVMPTAGNLSGEVVTRSHRAAENVCATVTGLNAATRAVTGFGTETGGSGSYDITQLVPGPYQVSFQPGCEQNSVDENQWYKDKPSPAGATRVVVRAGHTTAGIGDSLVLGGSISGRVTTGGKPVSGACVFAQSVTQPDDYGSAATSKAGRYVIQGLNSGQYELEFFPCFAGSATLAEQLLPHLVRVTAPHAAAGANASLVPAGTISGTVLGDALQDGSQTVVPQPGVCADAFQVNGFGANSAAAGTNGTFRITNLPPGRYVVYIGDIGCGSIVSNLAPQWYENAATSAKATVVSVSARGVTTLATVTLATNGAISGTVTGPGGTPVAGVCVTATTALSADPEVAVSGAGGTYSLLGLATGKYRVEFSSGCGASGYLTQWWNGKASAATANTVTVTAATTSTDVNASLRK
jgi:hypothetical protein